MCPFTQREEALFPEWLETICSTRQLSIDRKEQQENFWPLGNFSLEHSRSDPLPGLPFWVISLLLNGTKTGLDYAALALERSILIRSYIGLGFLPVFRCIFSTLPTKRRQKENVKTVHFFCRPFFVTSRWRGKHMKGKQNELSKRD